MSNGPADEVGASGVSEITRLSNRFVTDLCALSPLTAVMVGRDVVGDGRLDDLSPDGLAAIDDLVTSTLTAVRHTSPTGADDEVARDVLVERLEVERDRYRSGWAHADLNVLASPLQNLRQAFDLMRPSTADEWATVAARMAEVPQALAGYRRSLLHGVDHGHIPALRQVTACAQQCRIIAGTSEGPGYFRQMASGIGHDVVPDGALARGAALADAAYDELADFLTERLAPVAPQRDAVGPERYALASREFLGDTIDPIDTYQWGWHEFGRIEAELGEVAARISPDGGAAAAAHVLDADRRYQVQGTDGLQQWMQQLSDRAVADLAGSHFDIPEPLRTLDCRIAPAGGPVGAYYTAPSDDLTRPGAMWFSVEAGRRTFSTWRETTIVYHEGVPGHHLQLGTATAQRDRLTDFQRLSGFTSGHGEGWALYAEQLMRELGYLDDDGPLLGLLDSQLFRAARVIIDIGMHLELVIPAGTGFHEGERWTPELGLEFLLTRTISDPAHCRDEIDRYLGWPGQAPAYKVGERVWLAARDDARTRHGAAFDLRAFHTAALTMGGMGLGTLKQRLAAM